jgi:hypothetical protein
MKLFIIQFSQASCYFFKIFPSASCSQTPSNFVLLWGRKAKIHILINCQLNLQIFIRYYQLTTRISRRLSDLNFFVNVIFICDYRSHILLFECWHIFKDLLDVLYFDDVRHYVDKTNSCVEFSVFISRRTSLLTFTEVSTVFPCYISHPSHRHWFRHPIINQKFAGIDLFVLNNNLLRTSFFLFKLQNL